MKRMFCFWCADKTGLSCWWLSDIWIVSPKCKSVSIKEQFTCFYSTNWQLSGLLIAVERDTTQSQRHCFIGSKSLCYGPDNSVRPTSGDRDAVKGIYYECRVGLGNKAQQVVRLGLRQVVTCWWLGLTVVLAEVEVEAREGTTQRIRVAEVLEAGR